MADRDLFPANTRLEDDGSPHSQWSAMRVYESGPLSGQPLSPTSTKVAWTLRDGNGRFLYTYQFPINPQGIDRVESSRAQITATKGGIVGQDFGQGPAQITLHQLVAVGHVVPTNRGLVEVMTLRDDVLRFLKYVWIPATKSGAADQLHVYFHDNHLDPGRSEEVMFMPQGLTIQRSVQLQGVWVFQLNMTALQVDKSQDVTVSDDPSTPPINTRRYVVKAGDTLNRIVSRLAGPRASQKRRTTVLATVLKLNPFLRRRRHLYPGSPDFVGSTQVTVMPMRVSPGEVLTLPA